MYNLLLKNKILLILFLSLFLISSVVYVKVNTEEIYRLEEHTNFSSSIEKFNEPLIYKCCTPLNSSIRTKLFFLKTHKTASSTIQNVILRFAIKHSLDVLSVIYTTYYLPLTDLSLYPGTRTPNNKYQIFAHHMIYDYEKLRWYRYPNTLMVTVMRHPAKLFKSIFDYFQFNDFIGMSFQQFLNAPVKPAYFVVPTSFVAYRGYNQMSFDLGFDLIKNAKNQTAIDNFIKKIDREFDFVMITEHLEASLILLANLMGWPLEYVTHFPINTTPRNSKNNYTLTPRDERILMELNQVDSQLYQHFLNKFHKCVEQYGEEKLQRQVTQLKMMNEQLKARCVANLTRGSFLNAIEYIPRNASDIECKYLMNNEIDMEIDTYMEQSKRLSQPRIKELYFR